MKTNFNKIATQNGLQFNLVIQHCFLTLLLAMLFIGNLDAQVITQPIDMPSGWYWKGSTSSDFDFTKDDLVDQIIYDNNGIYFVGKSAAPKSTAQFANCATNTLMGDTGDAYISYRDLLCGNTWTTFFGCTTAKEYAYCIAEDKVNSKRFFYTAGEIDYNNTNPNPMTAASCVSTCNSIKQSAPGGDKDDGFIAKYDASGKLIRWTYLGGDGQDIILGIAVDPTTHDVFVTGYTESTPSTLTAGAGSTYSLYPTNKGGDIFIAQLDSCLDSLKFIGIYTGSDIVGQQDRPHGLSIFTSGSNKYLVIGGTTTSTTGFAKDPPVGTIWDNQYGTNNINGGVDGFLLKWNKMSFLTSGPLWCTYFGGKAEDRVRKILVMPDSSIYIVGETKSDTTTIAKKFHTTSDAFQKTRKDTIGKYDGFIAKFSKDGTQLKSFTFFGGDKDDNIKDINLYHSKATSNNNHDSIAIIGITSSSKVIPIPLYNASIISDSLDGDGKYSDMNKDADAFFAVITGTGEGANSQKVSFSSYVGGSNLEDETMSYGPAIALGIQGAEYIAFATKSSDVKDVCKVNVQTTSYSNPGDSSTHDVYIGTIYPFEEHYNACPSCSPCKMGDSEFSEDLPLKFYPVPFDNMVNLEINLLQDREAIIIIYNLMGQAIESQKVSLTQGTNVETYDFTGRPSGIYLCKVVIGDNIQEAKIIKE